MAQDNGGGAAGADPLGSYGNRTTPPNDQGKRQGKRSARVEAKAVQRRLTDRKSSALCFIAREPAVTVDVGRALTALVSGVHRCGSPWACPLCAPVIRQHRAIEIDAAVSRHLGSGGGVEFVTHTLRHHRGDSLSSRLDVVAQSLRWSLSGEPWRRRKAPLGYMGAIKAPEITWGEDNGWHAHSHTLMFFREPLSVVQEREFARWLFGRWLHVARVRGLGDVTERHGVDVRRVESAGALGDYLVSLTLEDGVAVADVGEGSQGWSPGMEIARSDLKRHTPFGLLAELVASGESKWRALWCEYEAATFGKRAVMWSPGLRRQLCGVEDEATDLELASSEGLDLALLRAVVPSKVWNRSVRDAATGRLLSEIEHVAAVLFFIADSLGQDVAPIGLPIVEGAR